MEKPTLLVCDSDRKFLDALEASAPSSLQVRVAENRPQAQLRISDAKERISVIAINSNLCAPHSIPLIRFAKMHRPGTPVCLLGDEGARLPAPEELDSVHVQQTFLKPIDPRALVDRIFPSVMLDTEKLLQLGKDTLTRPGEEAEHSEGEMHAIDAGSFLCGKKSFFDVYVLLRPGKYVMILKAGDEFETERVASYLRKGVKYFYIRKEAQQYFLGYCEKLTEALLASDKVGNQEKQKQVQNLGRETMEYLKSCGISELALVSAGRFADFSMGLVQKLGRKSPEIEAFLSSLSQSEHGTGTSLILSLILDAMEFRDKKVINVVAMGGLLHDIGLQWLPEGIREYQIGRLGPEEQQKYFRHPAEGAEILARVDGIPPLLPQVVRQHHESRDRKGFPQKLGAGQISPVSEMIGIADAYHLLVQRKQEEPELDPLAEMRNLYYDKYSFSVVSGFKKALNDTA